MPELSRRKFLLASAGLSAAGLVSSACAVSWPDLMREAKQRPLAEGSGILVILTLYGGNDGINTVIPYADNAYHDARPELAYAPGDVLALDGQLGLNPALKGLAQQWNNRKLAIVRGVGYPQPDHSHFRSMDIWQTASPSEPVSTGWIGRWLDATSLLGPARPERSRGPGSARLAAASDADGAPHQPDGVELGLLARILLRALAHLVAFVEQFDLFHLLECFGEQAVAVIELNPEIVARALQVLAPLIAALA